MNYRRAQDFVTLILTAVLQPRCALCDQNHRLPDRLCSACKVSVDNARRLQRTAQDKGPAPAGSHTTICSSKTLGGAIQPLSNTKNLGALDARVSVFNYQGAIADLITRWKYHGMIELTGYIADLIYADCPPIPAHDMVTVIPSHWQRRLLRGFDPVWLLAHALTKHNVIESPTFLLQPRRHLPFQHLKQFDQRYIASSHFRVMRDVSSKRILVFDDVVTSGSTLSAAALALKEAGAESVSGFTLASADNRPIAHALTAE